MRFRPAVTVALILQVACFAAMAQQSAEFGRATGETLVLTPKGSAPFSGSLELSLSSLDDVFGRGSSPSYGITAGGTLIQDRLWFFAAGSRQQVSQSRFDSLELPESVAFEPTVSMNTPAISAQIAPSSFLSLRYTGVVSDRSFFSASFTRSER